MSRAGEHVIGDVTFEQTVTVEITEHAMAHGVLELVPVGMPRDGWPRRILAEHAVDDTDVEMEVSVQR